MICVTGFCPILRSFWPAVGCLTNVLSDLVSSRTIFTVWIVYSRVSLPQGHQNNSAGCVSRGHTWWNGDWNPRPRAQQPVWYWWIPRNWCFRNTHSSGIYSPRQSVSFIFKGMCALIESCMLEIASGVWHTRFSALVNVFGLEFAGLLPGWVCQWLTAGQWFPPPIKLTATI
jgi:hypothetical protein